MCVCVCVRVCLAQAASSRSSLAFTFLSSEAAAKAVAAAVAAAAAATRAAPASLGWHRPPATSISSRARSHAQAASAATAANPADSGETIYERWSERSFIARSSRSRIRSPRFVSPRSRSQSLRDWLLPVKSARLLFGRRDDSVLRVRLGRAFVFLFVAALNSEGQIPTPGLSKSLLACLLFGWLAGWSACLWSVVSPSAGWVLSRDWNTSWE